MLCARDSILILTEHSGKYYTQAHLPAIVEEGLREAVITATVDAFLQAYEENINLNTDNSYDHLTVLAADPDRTVTRQGKKVPVSDFHGNIEYLHGKEAVWKHIRRDGGINPSTFKVSTRVENIRYDGGTATVTAHDNVSFYYKGNGAPSGMGASFEITLVQVDGAWLIADIFEPNDWFDAEYKNNPNFDPEKEIASYP